MRTPNYYKLVNEDNTLHCLRQRIWLEARLENGSYTICEKETKPDGFGERQRGDVMRCPNRMAVRIHFSRFDRRMIEDNYCRESAPRESEAGRIIGCTPRPSKVVSRRIAAGLNRC